MRSIKSLLAERTSVASDSSSSPPVGSISRFFFFASTSNSGSLRVFEYASRRILIRSGGIPGVATIGRPNSPEAKANAAKRRVASGVRYSSIYSLIVGTSAKRASRFLPVCTRTRTKFFLRQV